jgi:hypothetical protein
MNPTETILAILGGQAVLLAAGAWLGRTFLSQVLARELEKFKAELSRDNALTIERFKHDLQVRAGEKQTAYARVHEARMNAVAKLHASLLALSDAANTLVQDDVPSQSEDWKDRYRLATAAMKLFRSDIRNLKLYLPKNAAEQITSIADRLEALLIAVAANSTPGGTEGHWHRFETQLQRMIPIASTVLETEFQALVGIEHDA